VTFTVSVSDTEDIKWWHSKTKM